MALVALSFLLLLTAGYAWRQRQLYRSATLGAKGPGDGALPPGAGALDRLVELDQALIPVIDVPGLRGVFERHLPRLVPGRRCSVEFRVRGSHQCVPDEISAATLLDEFFPLVTGGRGVGVLAVHGAGPLSETGRDTCRRAAATMALAVGAVDQVEVIREGGLRDGLTGCFNRAQGLETLAIELGRAARSNSPLSVILLDIDHFKTINDHHGHLSGDAALRAVGELMRETLRSSDIKSRYGGDEFLVVLPDTSIAPAQVVAEALRTSLAATPITLGTSVEKVSVSLGVAIAAAGELDPETLVARADRALYCAKRLGRNRVEVARAPEAVVPSPVRQRRSPAGRRTPA